VAAAIVTYFPDGQFPDRLDEVLKQVGRVVIVDNGSDERSFASVELYRGREGITILRNSGNLGIATALNQAMVVLKSEGYKWVLTLDQDSTVTPDFVSALVDSVAADPNPHEVAMVGALRRDLGTGNSEHRWLRPKRGFPLFERVTCDHIDSDGVTLVITSGTLTNLEVFSRLGGFEDSFFIDLVDSEYCLRVRAAGYRTLVTCRAVLLHSLGSKRQVKFFGAVVSPTHHTALRRYYLFRNAFHVSRSYGRLFPHWFVYQMIALIEIILGVIAFEDNKIVKLKACALGAWDGIRGRTGSANRRF
jgi:rhamnosyltransferase